MHFAANRWETFRTTLGLPSSSSPSDATTDLWRKISFLCLARIARIQDAVLCLRKRTIDFNRTGGEDWLRRKMQKGKATLIYLFLKAPINFAHGVGNLSMVFLLCTECFSETQFMG